MLRIYFMQQWYALSDPAMEDALYEIESMRRFAGLELSDDAMPDETTILKFRHLLEKHGLTAQMMNIINDTLAAGPASEGRHDGRRHDHPCAAVDEERAKAARSRDAPDEEGQPVVLRHEDPRGRGRQFRLAHTVSVTPANASDISQLPHLLREDDRAVFGDKGYVNNDLKRHARKAGVFWGVSLKASKTAPAGEANKRFNHEMSSIRARVEHVFRVIKRQFGYTKVRYKGIAKNAAQVFSLIGLTNLYLARGA
jgi:IS5 family transposase